MSIAQGRHAGRTGGLKNPESCAVHVDGGDDQSAHQDDGSGSQRAVENKRGLPLPLSVPQLEVPPENDGQTPASAASAAPLACGDWSTGRSTPGRELWAQISVLERVEWQREFSEGIRLVWRLRVHRDLPWATGQIRKACTAASERDKRFQRIQRSIRPRNRSLCKALVIAAARKTSQPARCSWNAE